MTDKKKFIIGSRGSKLSLAYSRHVKNLLLKFNPQFTENSIEIKIIKTSGDIFKDKQISEIGGKGVFCKQIEDELLASKINLAVHSLKDLPTIMTDGLCVNALVKRNDPRNAFLSYENKSFNELKPKSKIGTSSFRRHAQLKLLRNDLTIIPMRGNIDTRIRKLQHKEFDAIILSLAGIRMLNLENEVKEIFTIEQMLPAIGQGAIALQCKQDDQNTLKIIRNDKKRFDVNLLTTNKNINKVFKQAKEFQVKDIIISDLNAYKKAKFKFKKNEINIHNNFDNLNKIIKKKK